MFFLVECYMHKNDLTNIVTVEAADEVEAADKADAILERLPYSVGGYDIINIKMVNDND